MLLRSIFESILRVATICGFFTRFGASFEHGKAAFRPLWNPLPGNRDVGGCDEKDLAKLEPAFQEAMTMADVAVDALEKLKKPMPHKDKSQASLTAQEASDQIDWIRIARLAFALFKINYSPDGVALQGSSWYMDQALGKTKSHDLERRILT